MRRKGRLGNSTTDFYAAGVFPADRRKEGYGSGEQTMKCVCGECDGSGKVVCPECDGRGTWEANVATMTLLRGTVGYEELVEVQKDAQRVIRQAEELCALKPERKDRYQQQLAACLRSINEQAKKARKAG